MAVNFYPGLNGYSGVRPFRFWCQKVLPLVYDDSLSYYELLCKVVDYINNLISDVSTAEENIQGLADAFVNLQNYVNNYFDNLDVQEEIDNKLDAMTEDGTLDEIVARVLEPAAKVFPTVADMAANTNLHDGDFAITYGFHSVGDRGGAKYQIVATGTYVADGHGIIELTSEGVVAIFSPDTVVNVHQLGAYGDNTHDDTEAIQYAVNNYRSVYFPSARGDIYLISDTINCNTYNSQVLFGDSVHLVSGHGIKRMDSMDATHPMINATQPGLTVHNLSFYGGGTADSPIGTCIYQNPVDQATQKQDSECKIYNCQFMYHAYAIDSFGRKGEFRDNHFMACGSCVRHNYTYEWQEGDGYHLKNDVGDRGFIFMDNKCHHVQVAVRHASGILHGAHISGNTLDSGSYLLDSMPTSGGMNGCLICDNICNLPHYGNTVNAIQLRAANGDYTNNVIANNTFVGNVEYGKYYGSAIFVPNTIGAFDNNVITGNVLHNANGSFIAAPVPMKNCVIANNVAENCSLGGVNNYPYRLNSLENCIIQGNYIGGSNASTTSAINFSGGTLSGVQIQNNVTNLVKVAGTFTAGTKANNIQSD